MPLGNIMYIQTSDTVIMFGYVIVSTHLFNLIK